MKMGDMERKETEYLDRIQTIRVQLWDLSDQAQSQHRPVGPDFGAVQTQLLTTIKNYRAFCRRHGLQAFI